MKTDIDDIDLNILRTLMNEGRKAWSDLASELKLSPPSAADRVRRLEENGVIRGYGALLNPEKIGCDLAAFVSVTLEKPRFREVFQKKIGRLTAVQECHHVAGDDDYLLKIRCRNTKELDQIVSEEIKSMEGVLRTRTTIVTDTLKETCVLPLPGQYKSRKERSP